MTRISRLAGLLALVILPAAPAAHRNGDDQQSAEYLVAVVFPPRLERFELFLIL